jgi:hypothetical protein
VASGYESLVIIYILEKKFFVLYSGFLCIQHYEMDGFRVFIGFLARGGSCEEFYLLGYSSPVNVTFTGLHGDNMELFSGFCQYEYNDIFINHTHSPTV